MTVRPAAPDEADAISALAMRSKAHWGYDDAFLAACRPELTWTPEQIREQDVLVWEEHGRLLGTTARGGSTPDGGLWAVFVDPEHHGRGIGGALVEAVLVRAADAGFRALTITADPNAEGFYRALGAARIGEVGSELLPGRVLPLLRFDLAMERSVAVPGGDLRVRVVGPPRGRRLLLLHGGPGLSDRYLDGLVAEFADTDRVATYAQRGVDPSTAGAPYDLAVQADDAVAVLDALGWADAVVLGHSFGGHLLLHVLAAHPDRVLAAIAVEPLGGVGDGGAAAFGAEMMRRLPASDRVRLERPGLTDAEQLAIVWPAYFPPASTVPSYTPIAVSSEASDGGWEAIETGLPGLADRLRGLGVPTLFVAADGSPMPTTASTETAAAIGAAAAVAHVGGGHFPWLQKPGEVRTVVDAFLADPAELSPGAAASS